MKQDLGALVISLDFELHWGVRDHTPTDGPHRKVLLNTPNAIEAMLELFTEFEVAATWATVGFLFANSREEFEKYRPEVLPEYDNDKLDPYQEPTGTDERDDPLHFASSLIEQIRNTPRQEIGTHTFSHFYCGEPGATPEAFRADLQAALRIASERSIELRSIVFPRNQAGSEYVKIAKELGIDVYRGNPTQWHWRVEDSQQGRQPLRRIARLLENWLPVSGDTTVSWKTVVGKDGVANVAASRFLRPYEPRFSALESFRLKRIAAGIRHAAKQGRIFHLWWHPHNFGAYLDENLLFLRKVLEVFAECRERHAMQSLSMAAAADKARSS